MFSNRTATSSRFETILENGKITDEEFTERMMKLSRAIHIFHKKKAVSTTIIHGDIQLQTNLSTQAYVLLFLLNHENIYSTLFHNTGSMREYMLELIQIYIFSPGIQKKKQEYISFLNNKNIDIFYFEQFCRNAEDLREEIARLNLLIQKNENPLLRLSDLSSNIASKFFIIIPFLTNAGMPLIEREIVVEA